MFNFKFIIFLLLLSLSSLSKDTPLQMIYENRAHIADVLNHLNFGESLSDTSIVSFRYFPDMTIKHILDSSYSCWEKNKEVILEEFINEYIPIANSFQKYRFYIQDSITISIVILFLDYPDYRKKRDENWVRDALNILINNTYFSSLIKHSSEIIDRLSWCKELETDKFKLLVLCKLPVQLLTVKRDSLINRENLLDSLFSAIGRNRDLTLKKYVSALDQSNPAEANKLFNKFADSLQKPFEDTIEILKKQIQEIKNIPLWVKARLGDTLAEKSIILGFRKNDGCLLKYYAMDASFVWTNPCKKAFFAQFNRDAPICPSEHTVSKKYIEKEEASNYHLCRSLQNSLLIYLARHHPDDPIFGNLLSSSRHNADFCKPELQVPYFMEFAKWAKKNYGADITYKGFKPYFIKVISADKSEIRDMCK